MATDNSKSVTLAQNRKDVAVAATCEICQLSSLLSKMAVDDENDLAVRGIALRINQLNGAILSALEEPNVPTGDLQYIVYGYVLPADGNIGPVGP